MSGIETLVGIILLGLFFLAIVCMLAINYKLVADACIEEEREKARMMARKEADRMFRNYIKNTEYHVYSKPVVLINESDIDWGENPKEVEG